MPFDLFPVSLKNSGAALVIEWNDGVQHSLPWRLLRIECPCATCREKRSQPLPPPTQLPVLNVAEARPMTALGMKPVGNYAYGIDFSDGHNTGIYSFETLRSLGEQFAAETAPANGGDPPE